jgi:hypothetical protein
MTPEYEVVSVGERTTLSTLPRPHTLCIIQSEPPRGLSLRVARDGMRMVGQLGDMPSYTEKTPRAMASIKACARQLSLSPSLSFSLSRSTADRSLSRLHPWLVPPLTLQGRGVLWGDHLIPFPMGGTGAEGSSLHFPCKWAPIPAKSMPISPTRVGVPSPFDVHHQAHIPAAPSPRPRE